MSIELDKKVSELGYWFMEHHKQIPEGDLWKKLEFNEVAMRHVIEILAIIAKDMQIRERRDAPRSQILRPTGVRLVP